MARRIIGTLVALAVVCAAVLLILAMKTSTPPASVTAIPPVNVQAEARARAQKQLQEPQLQSPYSTISNHGESAATPSRSDIMTVRFAQDDINTLLQSDPFIQSRMRSRNISAVHLSFQPPNLAKANVWIDYEGASREVTVSGKVVPTDSGAVQFQTESTSIGMLPIPAAMVQSEIDSAASSFANDEASKLPLKVQSIAVVNGDLVLSGPKK